MDSLRGQNSSGRRSGDSSSLSPSIRFKLFKRLQKLDREIINLDVQIRQGTWEWMDKKYYKTLIDRREKLDQKRKDIRNKRKGYKND